ncbi:pyridoxal phosphate-dependent aminotransferase [Notoacmeibacter ruber]|uniref:Aminotransferase n=1 Tax=Notoacmeibacter ruber TaxID=2670375 RepID=A0A3L7JG48_9HYPH|nr:pyridoxal phosphate-dependent aminotransferase [Notoacmeibacter ruber]RLQ89189.1 pyridoxal phosphate-dependent aminotransferase [Notoacmeibacter ruber]
MAVVMTPETSGAFRPANRMQGLALSEIVQISEKAAQLRAEGRDIVSFGTGEPDFPTPPDIIAAAHKSALAGQTRYTPTAGTPALRDAIAAQANSGRENVLVSTGAKQVIANALMATLDPGDEVIIPTPYWTTYSDIVRICQAVAVTVPCPMDEGFKLSPDMLEQAITPRSRWLMLNSPSNPSGAVYSAEEIRALAAVLERNPHVWILSDEIYEHLTYGDFASFAAEAPALKERTLTVNGASKAWSMTGWRIGWGIGPRPLIAAMAAVQGQFTSGASSISQAAALAAIQGDTALLKERCAILKSRRDRVVAALNAMPGLRCRVPEGAFYAFASCAGLLKPEGGPFKSDADLCRWLLEDAGVALVPGRAFGLPGYVRLSFAYSDAELSDGLSRMAEALKRISS